MAVNKDILTLDVSVDDSLIEVAVCQLRDSSEPAREN